MTRFHRFFALSLVVMTSIVILGGFYIYAIEGSEYGDSASQKVLQEDPTVEMKHYVRTIVVQITYSANEEEAKTILETDTLPPELIYIFSREDFVSFTAFEGVGIATVKGDVVFAPSALFQEAYRGLLSPNRISMSVVLLPDTSEEVREDGWRIETIFEGTAFEFMQSNKFSFAQEFPFAMLQRPFERMVLAEDDGFYDIADPNTISRFDSIVYLRNIGGIFIPFVGYVVETRIDDGIFYLDGNFANEDVGAPVFVIQNGELKLLGSFVAKTNELGVAASVFLAPDEDPTGEGE